MCGSFIKLNAFQGSKQSKADAASLAKAVKLAALVPQLLDVEVPAAWEAPLELLEIDTKQGGSESVAHRALVARTRN